MPADNTPMRSQYLQIKEKHQDCILFFRLGDFYEMFDQDAYIASKELDLALTTRDRNKENPEERTPMCGVPYHSCDAYIARLISKGYKVAICEQTEDPATAKGLVSREVVRIITPGTVMEGSMLEEGEANYLCTIFLDSFSVGMCFADASTGEICYGYYKDNIEDHIKNELERFSPREVILNAAAGEAQWLERFLRDEIVCLTQVMDDLFGFMLSAARVCEQFDVSDIGALELDDKESAVCACGALLSYLYDTQKMALTHINTLSSISDGRFMDLDLTSIRSLELNKSLHNNGKTAKRHDKGSLLSILDMTNSSIGSRRLRSWLNRPLLAPAAIKRRLNAVNELVHDSIARGELSKTIGKFNDLDRLASKLISKSLNCRDLNALASTVQKLPEIKRILAPMKSALLAEAAEMDDLSDIYEIITPAITDSPPVAVKEGGIIREGYNEEVDRLRSLVNNSRESLLALENKERERSGIKKLRISYNRVFGYFFEVPRSSGESVPEDYIRRQTLANNERFVTHELKNLEGEILSAGGRLSELEYEIFTQIRDQLKDKIVRIQKVSRFISQVDVLNSFAQVSANNNYCMPEVDISDALEITDGRHPVVETAMYDSFFVANDTKLDCASNRAIIITGPNMAGKSTYMRQVALIVLMAQIGCFVPAKSAHIGIVDKIFTRIGASDDLFSGRSTFMVEMTEIAGILKNATKNSLLIIDEIGRGTSTYDGLAIAKAVLEYCADSKKLGAKTLFSTHYHELTELENELEGIKNYNIAVKKRGDDIIFLRRIVPGGADESYGIEAAKLSGVPDSVIKRAKNILGQLQNSSSAPSVSAKENLVSDSEQFSFADMSSGNIKNKLLEKDLNTLTPIEAMNFLFELKKIAENS